MSGFGKSGHIYNIIKNIFFKNISFLSCISFSYLIIFPSHFRNTCGTIFNWDQDFWFTKFTSIAQERSLITWYSSRDLITICFAYNLALLWASSLIIPWFLDLVEIDVIIPWFHFDPSWKPFSSSRRVTDSIPII